MFKCENCNLKDTSECHNIRYVYLDKTLGFFKGSIKCGYLKRLIRKPRGLNKAGIQTVSLSSLGGDGDPHKKYFAAKNGYSDEYYQTLESRLIALGKELPPRQNQVFNGILEGNNITALAKAMGISHQAVSKLLTKVRGGLRKRRDNDYI